MSIYLRPSPDRTYSFEGKRPYGASDLLSIDAFLDTEFTGNATAQLIHEGFFFDGLNLCTPRGNHVARFVEEN